MSTKIDLHRRCPGCGVPVIPYLDKSGRRRQRGTCGNPECANMVRKLSKARSDHEMREHHVDYSGEWPAGVDFTPYERS